MKTLHTETERRCVAESVHLQPNEIRRAVLRCVFDGDPQVWIDFLLRRGSRRQIEEDLPFAIRAAMEGNDDHD